MCDAVCRYIYYIYSSHHVKIMILILIEIHHCALSESLQEISSCTFSLGCPQFGNSKSQAFYDGMLKSGIEAMMK